MKQSENASVYLISPLLNIRKIKTNVLSHSTHSHGFVEEMRIFGKQEGNCLACSAEVREAHSLGTGWKVKSLSSKADGGGSNSRTRGWKLGQDRLEKVLEF